MKRNQRSLVFFLVLFAAVVLLSPVTAEAAKKGKVKTTVKNGVLTISGKGVVPSFKKYKNKDKIKKIVVKKGITSLPIGAFSMFHKVKEIEIADSVQKIGEGALPKGNALKKVTMPGTFKFVSEKGDEMSNELTWDWEKCRIDTITFNTPLSLETLAHIRSNHLIVSEKDEKYKSVDGVIYSKDGKSLVRVPAFRETLTVEEGCEEFCIQAVKYATDDYESDTSVMCGRLEKVVLPASIRTVSEKKYFAYTSILGRAAIEFVVETDQLDSDSITALLNNFSFADKEKFLSQFDYVSAQDDMYINTRDDCLLVYNGKAEEVIIPDNIKKISAYAFCNGSFYYSGIKRVVLPDTVTEIGDCAFEYCRELQEIKLPAVMTRMGVSVFSHCEKLKEIVYPEGLTEIPEYTFWFCKKLKKVTLPDCVSTIKKCAFDETRVPPSILTQGNIKEIHSWAFSAVRWKEAVIPKTVEKIDAYAFSTGTLKKVTICGSTSQIDPRAFCSNWSDSKRATLQYKSGIKEWQTGLELRSWSSAGIAEFDWQRVNGADGYQIQVCDDKSFRKKKKTYYAKKETTQMRLENKKIKMKYVRIRPYQVVNGKKTFGRWCVG